MTRKGCDFLNLKFIFGLSGTGKTDYILNSIAEMEFDINKNIIFIVPEQFTLQAEADLIEKTKGRGIINTQILSFKRLAYNVFNEVGGVNKKVLDDLGKAIILKKIIFEVKDKLVYYKDISKKTGFIIELSKSVSEFLKYDISKDRLKLTLDQLEEGSLLKSKISDLCIIYESYLKYFEEDFISDDVALDNLVDKISSSNKISNTIIYIDGFYGFNPQEFKVIRKLVKHSIEVNVSLAIDDKTLKNKNYEKNTPYYEVLEVVRKFLEIASDLDIKVEKPLYLKKVLRYENAGLKHFNHQYFENDPKVYKSKTNINVTAAANAYDEIVYVAKTINYLVREKGYSYLDIAITGRRLEKYNLYIKGIFSDYEIPFFLDAKKSIMVHPLIELIYSFLDIVIYDFSQDNMFRFFRTNLTDLNEEHIDIVENHCLAYGIKGYKWKKDDWTIKNTNLDDEYFEMINELKDIAMNPLKNLIKNYNNKKEYKVNSIILTIFEMLDVLKIKEKLSYIIIDCENKGDTIGASFNKQAYDNVVTIFEKLNEMIGETYVTLEEMNEILMSAFSTKEVAIIPQSLDQVIVGDIERSRFPKIKAMFVIGVNENVLPKTNFEISLLNEEEKSLIETKGLALSYNSDVKYFIENYFVYMGIMKPTEMLYFSYTISNYEGTTLKPSPLIKKILNIFSTVETKLFDEFDYFDISTHKANIEKITHIIKCMQEKREYPKSWDSIISFYLQDDRFKDELDFIVDALVVDDKKDKLSINSIKKVYGNEMKSSVSKLEKFSNCPFAYFVKYGLKAKNRQIYEFDSLELGNLYHKVLENFSAKLKSENLSFASLSEREINDSISKIMKEIIPTIKNEILLSTAANKHLTNRIERISKRAIWALNKQAKMGNFKLFDYEASFGANENLPPIIIDINDKQKLILEGKVDRIDVVELENDLYVNVIDYKSSSKKFNYRDFYYGLQLQLMIYLDMLVENNSEIFDKNVLPAGIFYFKIDDPLIEIKKQDIDIESIESIENMLLKELKMSGLVLFDKKVLKSFDEKFGSITETKINTVASDVLPVKINKDGKPDSRSDTMELEKFSNFLKFAKHKAKTIGEEILAGNIEINPYKSAKTVACTYCEYRKICKFDDVNDFSKYNIAEEMSNETVAKKIEEVIIDKN